MQNTFVFRFLCVTLLVYTSYTHTLLAAESDPPRPDTVYWQTNHILGLFFSQHSYSEYYKGGGINSVALGSSYELNADYNRQKHHWKNLLKARYGVIKMADHPIQKNDDHFEIDSKYGYQVSKHLQLSGLVNFQTRIHDINEINRKGERGKRIANFLAPAFINVGTGIDYTVGKKEVSLYYSPVNSKVTIVADESLISQYIPNALPGQSARYELGSLFRLEVKKEVMTNVHIHTVGSLFTNHLQDFGKFDVNFENKIKFTINKLFSVNLLTQVTYDEDVLFDIPLESGEEGSVSHQGPRTQFREVLNIGLTHKF